MEIVVCIKVFNEEDFIHECIQSIYDFCDRIIVIDSCFAGMERIIRTDRINSSGGSGDDTLKIVRAFPDVDNKIEIRERGFIHGDQTIIYNEFIQSVEVGDYVWLVDGDEVYPRTIAQRVTEAIQNNYHAIWMPSRIYWHDFLHMRNGAGWEKPHQRIYMKVDDSAYYDELNLDVKWKDPSGNSYGFGIPPKTTHYRGHDYNVIIGSLNDYSYWYHHYAYVKSDQRILEKTVSQYYQNEVPKQDGEWRHCKQFADPIEFKIMTHPWFTNLDYDELKEVKRNSHPSTMLGNKWNNYTWDEQRSTIDYHTATGLLKDEIN